MQLFRNPYYGELTYPLDKLIAMVTELALCKESCVAGKPPCSFHPPRLVLIMEVFWQSSMPMRPWTRRIGIRLAGSSDFLAHYDSDPPNRTNLTAAYIAESWCIFPASHMK